MKIDKIIEALKSGNCVLFVGPEIIKKDGQDLQKLFFDALNSNLKTEASYDDNEKLWLFSNTKTRRKITIELADFYAKNQNLENPVLKQIAEIPFPLMVSLLPDDSLDKLFTHYNLKHEFDYFDTEKRDCAKIEKDNPMIYNLFGDIKTRQYVLSYPDFYNFTKAVTLNNGLPTNLKYKLDQANYYIFIGFEFDKWYNILLMYILNNIKGSQHAADKFVYENKNAQELYKKITDDNLNVEIIEEDYTDFISELYLAAEKEGLLRKLQTEIEQITNQLNEKQEYLEFLKEEQITATEPKIKFGFRKDIKNIETEIQELKEQLISTKK